MKARGRILVSMEIFHELLRTDSVHHFRIVEGLEKDAVITGVHFDPYKNEIALDVVGSQFPELPEGHLPCATKVIVNTIVR